MIFNAFLHFYDPSASTYSVLLHHDVVHASGTVFKGNDLGVMLSKYETSVCVVYLHSEAAILLQVKGDLVGGGVGVDVERQVGLFGGLVQMIG